MSSQAYNGIAAGFGATASTFVVDSIGAMVNWIIVMTAVILADLIAGIAKSYKLGETIRFSKAVRDSMAKFCTYYAVVVCACMTEIAMNTDLEVAKDTCLIVIVIEAASIFSNILKWHGYSIDFTKVISFFVAKKIGANKEDINEMITKDK